MKKYILVLALVALIINIVPLSFASAKSFTTPTKPTALSSADIQSLINQLQEQIKLLQSQTQGLQSQLESPESEIIFTKTP